MTVDQLDELIRKYLSTGVAMVLVLVGPAVAPPGAAARAQAATTSAHSTDGLSGWGVYDGPGHADEGTRSPAAASVADGVLTTKGDAEGTTAGMAWGHGKGQKYGRWEGRVRAPASDPTYNALLLLWPDAEDFPEGGEIDFMEMTDHTCASSSTGSPEARRPGQAVADAGRLGAPVPGRGVSAPLSPATERCQYSDRRAGVPHRCHTID